MYGFSDGEETMEDEHYPQSLFVCGDMEVVGNVDEDGEVEVDMFETGEDVVVESVDDDAPLDDENPSEFSAVLFLQHCCVHLGCLF